MTEMDYEVYLTGEMKKELNKVLNRLFTGAAYTKTIRDKMMAEARKVVDKYVAQGVEYDVILPEVGACSTTLVATVKRKDG